MDMTIFKERRGAAKNKIDVALNVTVFKILPAAIDEDRVLPAEKTTVAKYNAIGIHANGQCLSDRARRIFERDVLRREIFRVDHCGRRAKCANRFVVQSLQICIQVKREEGGFRIFANEMEETFLALNVNQFLIGAGLDVNENLIVRRAHWNSHDRGLNRFERRAAIGRDKQVRICVKRDDVAEGKQNGQCDPCIGVVGKQALNFHDQRLWNDVHRIRTTPRRISRFCKSI